MDHAHTPAAEHRNAVPVQAVPGLGTELKTLPNQPARITIDPRAFVQDIATGFARLQKQAEEQQRRERHQQVLGSLDDIDRDRLAEWRRDDREADEAERAE